MQSLGLEMRRKVREREREGIDLGLVENIEKENTEKENVERRNRKYPCMEVFSFFFRRFPFRCFPFRRFPSTPSISLTLSRSNDSKVATA